MFRAFEAFIAKMVANFRRIAKATKHEMTVEELHSDAWIVADEIGVRRGREIDFSDPVDQGIILGALDIRNVKRPEKHMYYASRIDQSYEGDEGYIDAWSNRLRAHETSDPLELMLLQEEMAVEEAALDASYSEFAAYIVTLFRFKNDRLKLCAYLAITIGTLRRRMNCAENIVKVQPSLFDRIQRIAEDFMPAPGRSYAIKEEKHLAGNQLHWDFGSS